MTALAFIFLFIAIISLLIYLDNKGSHGYSVNGKGIPGFIYYIIVVILVLIYLSLISN